MSKQVLLSLLAQGNNGNEILQILDSIAADADDSVEADVEFWCMLGGAAVWLCGALVLW